MKADNYVKVEFENNMHGVFASRGCITGTIVLSLSLKDISDIPTRTSIHIGNGIHAEDPVGIYINHACSPTCKIEGQSVVSLVDLCKGDEITFDYRDNELNIASPFTCRCCGILIVQTDS